MRTISKSLAEYYNKEYFDRENVLISEIKKITLGWETELYSYIVEFDEAERQIREERVIRLYEGNFVVEKAAKEFRMMSYLLMQVIQCLRSSPLRQMETSLENPSSSWRR